MLGHKDIITKHYALGMSGMAIRCRLPANPMCRSGRSSALPYPTHIGKHLYCKLLLDAGQWLYTMFVRVTFGYIFA